MYVSFFLSNYDSLFSHLSAKTDLLLSAAPIDSHIGAVVVRPFHRLPHNRIQLVVLGLPQRMCNACDSDWYL
jgi:hypothetical protein